MTRTPPIASIFAGSILLACPCNLAEANPDQPTAARLSQSQKGQQGSSADAAGNQQPAAAVPRTTQTTLNEGVEEVIPKNGQNKEGLSLISVLPPGASLIGALLSLYFFIRTYRLNRILADRTLNVEAQKLLLEINKQFLADPDLFAIYEDHPGRDGLLSRNPGLSEKIRALAFLKLNIFEIVIAAMPRGKLQAVWKAFFEDSLKRCSVLGKELERNAHIYHPSLVEAYRKWKTTGTT